jgi:hypothetical protein
MQFGNAKDPCAKMSKAQNINFSVFSFSVNVLQFPAITSKLLLAHDLQKEEYLTHKRQDQESQLIP